MSKQQEHNSRLLIQASRTGDIEEVKRLVPLSDPADRNEALLRASLYGHIECVKLLLLSVSNSKKDNSAALRWAAKTGNTEILKLLLPYSDPKAHDSGALRMAVLKGHIDVIKLLIPVSDYRLALQYMQADGTSTVRLQHCIDEYEALQQKQRLHNTLSETVDIKSNTTKRKM